MSKLPDITPPDHPPGVRLLLYADGELTAAETAEIKAHLKACWHCRAQVARVEATVGDIIAFDEKVLAPRLTPPHGWPGTLILPPDRRAAPRFASWRAVLRRSLLTPRLAGWAVAVLVAALVAGLVLIQSNLPATVSAAEFLDRARQAQAQELQTKPQPVSYQKLRVRRNGQTIAYWEIWRDHTQNHTRQTIAAEIPPNEAGRVLLELDQILRLNRISPRAPLSAEAFNGWRAFLQEKTDEVSPATLEDGAPGLMLRTTAPEYASLISEARLSARVRDWHSVALSLAVRTPQGPQNYELTETAASVVNLPELGPAFFAGPRTVAQPDALPVITAVTPTVAATATPGRADAVSPADTPAPEPPTQATATELEVELISRLDQVNAFLGEQLDVTRGPRGVLAVYGVVADAARKREILQALSNFKDHPLVRLEVQTVAEAQARQGKRRGPKAAADINVPEPQIPLADEVRAYLARRGVRDDDGREIGALAVRVIQRSAQMRSHARALRQIAARFTPEELAKLDATTRQRWRVLVNRHAQALQQAAQGLRREVSAIVPAQSGSDDTGPVAGEADIIRAAQRLYELANTADEAVRRSFAINAHGTAPAPVKTANFWRALNGAENIAGKISRP